MKYSQNRKARLAAGVAGAIFALGVASPALAQDATADDGAIAEGGNALFLDASQAQGARQIQTGDATATADDDGYAYASNDLSLNQTQVNGGFGYGQGDPFDDTGFFDDDDRDGVLDDYDYVILVGDYDNDGFVDYLE